MNILIIDDRIINAKNLEKRINNYCSDLFNEICIDSTDSTIEAYSKIELKKPDIIIIDIHLNPNETGLDFIFNIRKEKLIDYRTQCCYYSAVSDSNKILPYLNMDFVLKKGATREMFREVINKMIVRRKKCDLKYLFGFGKSIFLHNVFYIEAVTDNCIAYYLDEAGNWDARTSQERFINVKDDILLFDFMFQPWDTKIINTNFYSEYKKEVKSNKNTFYLISNHTVLDSLNESIRMKHKEHKISERYEELFKLKYSY